MRFIFQLHLVHHANDLQKIVFLVLGPKQSLITIVCFDPSPLVHLPFFFERTPAFFLPSYCTSMYVLGRRRNGRPWPQNKDKQWGGCCGCQNLFAGLVCHPILPSPNHAHASPPHLTYSIIVCISCNPSRLFSSRPWNYNLMIYFCSYNGKGKNQLWTLCFESTKWNDHLTMFYQCGRVVLSLQVVVCLPVWAKQ